jgi:hypothetical protein
MKKSILIFFIILVGASILFAQSNEIAGKKQAKEQPKSAMQYEYVISHDDSIRIRQLLLDPPVSPRPFPTIDINPYHYSRPNNDVIIIMDGDRSKEY